MSVLVSVVDHATPRSLLPKQFEMEAGVRIELTIGVLQAKNGGSRLFTPLADFALNTLVDSHLRDFYKTVNIVKHRATLSKVSITASITGFNCLPLLCTFTRESLSRTWIFSTDWSPPKSSEVAKHYDGPQADQKQMQLEKAAAIPSALPPMFTGSRNCRKTNVPPRRTILRQRQPRFAYWGGCSLVAPCY